MYQAAREEVAARRRPRSFWCDAIDYVWLALLVPATATRDGLEYGPRDRGVRGRTKTSARSSAVGYTVGRLVLDRYSSVLYER